MTREANRLLALSGVALALAVAVIMAEPFEDLASFARSSYKPFFGWISAALVISTMVYSLRKRYYLQWTWPLKFWKDVHIILGFACLLAILLHSGGGMGDGLARILVMLILGLTLTGVWGVAAHGAAPKLMTESLQNPVYKNELEEDVNNILNQMHTIMGERSPEFNRMFQRHILPAISISRPTAKQQEAIFLRYDPTSRDPNAAARDLGTLPEREREIFYSLAEKTLDIIEIRRSQAYQNIMNQWLFWHIGLSAVLLAVMFFHVVSSFYF